MIRTRTSIGLAVIAGLSLTGPTALMHTARAEHRGCAFVGWTNFTEWSSITNAQSADRVLISPEVALPFAGDEVIPSWNAVTSADNEMEVRVRAIYPGRSSQFYQLGRWTSEPGQFPRASIRNQRDNDGEVQTDTLILKEPSARLQVEVLLKTAKASPAAQLKLVAMAVLDSKTHPGELAPNQAAWGKVIDVPRRSQLSYPGGENAWCSPTSVSMDLSYWAALTHRRELDVDVPQVAKGVFDPEWQGTGNWPFNTAFAGSLPGMRAFVTRLSDVSELEDWIVAGVPVVISVSYDLLRGEAKPKAGDGHLVVCVGFTPQGDVVVNDPGTRHEVRRTFPRKDLIRGWDNSRNTVYLIYPESVSPPTDRFGHWSLQGHAP